MYKKIIKEIKDFYKSDPRSLIGGTMLFGGIAIILIAILVALFLWHWAAGLIGFAILIAITGGMIADV